MSWTETETRTGRRWERDDGLAVLTLRETATGDWAVTLDVLEQADDGPEYVRWTLDDEETALERAADLREQYD